MKIFFSLFTLILTVHVSTFGQSSDKQFEDLIRKCGGFNAGNYKCMPYLKLASYLQAFDPTKAIALLKGYAKTGKYEDQVIVLTKMFFQSKENTPLRRPMIGGASFFGGTDYKDWPGEPIEIINNVPFLITRGYSLGGQAEPSIKYLEYCMENGQWTTNKYDMKEEELKIALNILLTSKKWVSALSIDDKKFFENQINE